MVWCVRMESEKSTSLYVWRVVVFLYAGSRRHSCNLTDMRWKASAFEATFKARGFQVLFLPKFHCELNFIEQCWGYAKRLYCHNPESSREETLQKYALAALDAVLLKSMRWCVHIVLVLNLATVSLSDLAGFLMLITRVSTVKFHGHCVLPETVMAELNMADSV
jgi:hypothetical protein